MKQGRRALISSAILAALAVSGGCATSDTARSDDPTASSSPSTRALATSTYTRAELMAALPQTSAQLAGHRPTGHCPGQPHCDGVVSVDSGVDVTTPMTSITDVSVFLRYTPAQMRKLTSLCTPIIDKKAKESEYSSTYGEKGTCTSEPITLDGWAGRLQRRDTRLIDPDGPRTNVFHAADLLLNNGHHLLEVIAGDDDEARTLAHEYLARLDASR